LEFCVISGVVSGIAVSVGLVVDIGYVLFSIDVMKMETSLHAERHDTIAEILVKAGDQIDTKDLLLSFA
jgi:pyruvate carboxylase